MSVMDNLSGLLTSSGSYLDKRATKFASWAKYLAGIGLLFLLAPVLWTAFGGLIAAIGIAVVGSTAAVLEGPFTRVLKALRMHMLLTQAKKFPIPTMQAILADGRSSASAGQRALEEFAGDFAAHRLNMQNVAQKFPKEAESLMASVYAQSDELERRRIALTQYVRDLDAFEQEVSKASMLWDAAQANKRFMQRSRGLGLNFDDQLQAETALAAVGEALVRSEAAMKFAVFDEGASSKLAGMSVPLMSVEDSSGPRPRPISNRVEQHVGLERRNENTALQRKE